MSLIIRSTRSWRGDAGLAQINYLGGIASEGEEEEEHLSIYRSHPVIWAFSEGGNYYYRYHLTGHRQSRMVDISVLL